jgi:hypothetical protein
MNKWGAVVREEINVFDVLACHIVLCIVAGMMFLHIMNISSYTVVLVDVMTAMVRCAC